MAKMDEVQREVLEVLKKEPDRFFDTKQIIQAMPDNYTLNVVRNAITKLWDGGLVEKQLNGGLRHIRYKVPGSAEQAQPQQSAFYKKMDEKFPKPIPIPSSPVQEAMSKEDREKYLKAIEEAGLKIKAQAVEIENLNKRPPADRIVAIEIKEASKKPRKVEGIFHKQFPKLLQLAQARKPTFMFGPTGCGKSHVASQIAEVLKLPYGFVSCTAGMSEGVLGGRLLPLGQGGTFKYSPSEFVHFYENGGVFLLDEIDAADPNVLLLINAALANNQMAIHNRPDKPMAKRHKDFVCFAAANTFGTGADRLYSGRSKLDASTLDRFQVGKVILDYDPSLEEALCPDGDLLTRCRKIRKAIVSHRMERVMSTRFIRDAYEMTREPSNWTLEELDAAFFAGWRDDEIHKVKNEIKP